MKNNLSGNNRLRLYFQISTLIILLIALMILSFSIKQSIILGKIEEFKIVEITTALGKLPNKSYSVIISVKDKEGTPVRNAFVSVYNFDNGEEIYGYSMIRTDDAGIAEIELKKGRYDVITSTDHEKTPYANKFSFILRWELEVNDVNSEIKISKNLRRMNLRLANFPQPIPRMKVEAVMKTKYGYSHPHMLASNGILSNQHFGDDSFEFYLGEQDLYNLNLDTLFFDPDSPSIYALAMIDVAPGNDNYFEFNFYNLKEQQITISDLEYGWFKLISSEVTGDFQGMYFGKPVNIYTNLLKLKLISVYATLPECINKYLHDNPTDKTIDLDLDKYRLTTAINICTMTDVRFDTYASTGPNEHLKISTPSNLKINPDLINAKAGEQVRIKTSISDSNGNEITRMYFHQLWDQRILPKVFIRNMAGKIVYQQDLFDESFDPKSKMDSVIISACAPPGKYNLEINVPIFIWDTSWLSDSVIIEITPGSNCQPDEKPKVLPKYYSWQDLYSRRQELFQSSDGYLMNWPTKRKQGGKTDTLVFDRPGAVSSCQDLNNAKSHRALIVKITGDYVYNEKNQLRLNSCLADFVKEFPGKTYILKNDFWGDKPFLTQNWYVMYHFYLILHSAGDSSVGILSEKFYEIMMGFPDFIIIDPNRFLYQKIDLNESDLRKWMAAYDGYDYPPLYFIKNFESQ